jgi:hypothetical protein
MLSGEQGVDDAIKAGWQGGTRYFGPGNQMPRLCERQVELAAEIGEGDVDYSDRTEMATDKGNRKQREELARQLQSANPGLEVVHPRAAGIDVGNGAHYVAVRPDQDPEPVRRVECFTADLHRLAECSTRGDYLGLVELGDTSLKKNPGRPFRKAPDLSQPEMKAGGVTKSHFQIDTTSVVAGYGKDGEDAKTADKRRYFVRLLEQAASVMPVLEAAAIALSRANNLFSLRAALEEHRAAATDKVTLQIDGEFPVESAVWHCITKDARRVRERGVRRPPQATAALAPRPHVHLRAPGAQGATPCEKVSRTGR